MKVETKKHAKYSASKSHQWLACPGSVHFSEDIPDPPESAYASEGTRAHECLEFLLKNINKPASAFAMAREKWPLQVVVHAEMARSYVTKRMVELRPAALLIEERILLPVSESGQFGTADIVVMKKGHELVVMDFKYGAGIPVMPEGNSQLIFYALGVAHKYDYKFSSVELVIIQPRREVAGSYIRSWFTTVGDLRDWRLKFELGIEATKKPDALFYSGDHCRFCKAKEFCFEYENQDLRRVQDDFPNDL